MMQGISHAHIERFPMAGHFLMLEEPQEFTARLKNFLDREEPVQQVSLPAAVSPTPSVTLAP
jgi:hypothetical protein